MAPTMVGPLQPAAWAMLCTHLAAAAADALVDPSIVSIDFKRSLMPCPLPGLSSTNFIFVAPLPSTGPALPPSSAVLRSVSRPTVELTIRTQVFSNAKHAERCHTPSCCQHLQQAVAALVSCTGMLRLPGCCTGTWTAPHGSWLHPATWLATDAWCPTERTHGGAPTQGAHKRHAFHQRVSAEVTRRYTTQMPHEVLSMSTW
jgi:hypothetical protein